MSPTHIALFPNPQKELSTEIAEKICHFLKEKKIHVFAEDEQAQKIKALPLSTIHPQEIQYTITLGGDGTILRLVRKHPELTCPVIGINLGSLGFMADTPIQDIFTNLQFVVDQNFTIEKRLMMEGSYNHNTRLALNDIVIHRARNPSLIELAIYVDGLYLNTFSADGMIISTPSGSTAYSLAAGGPILTTNLEAFVITPICAHTISNRPIVLFPKKAIKIQYIGQHHPVEVIYDGFSTHTLSTNEEVIIKPAERKFQLVKMPNHDDFATLRTKLGWTGKLKH